MKSRNILPIMILTCLLLTAFSGNASAAPKIKIDSTHFDFGHTPEGLPVLHKYWAYNVGTDTLKISMVRVSCGCTSVPLSKKELAPGDSVGLELKFDTKRFKGQISKTATVVSNDPVQPEVVLKFTSRVGLWEGAIVGNHSQVYLDTLGKAEQVITLKNTSASPYKINVLSPVADYMDFTISATEIPAKGEVDLTFRPSAKTPLGEYNTSVTLRFEGPQTQNISIPVFGVGYLP